MGGFIGDAVRAITGSDSPDSGDGGLLNVGLSMIPGVGGYLGGREANSANAAQSAAQMAFQERMSNTAHVRQVADLKNAGLNPLLSANAGASTPQGSQATMQNTLASLGETGKGIAELSNTIKEGKQKDAQTELLKSQKNNTDMDTTVKSKSVPEAEMKNKWYEWASKKAQALRQWNAERERNDDQDTDNYIKGYMKNKKWDLRTNRSPRKP